MASARLKQPRHTISMRDQAAALILFDVVVVAVFITLTNDVSQVWQALGCGLLILVRWQLGLYRTRFDLSALDELPTALKAAIVTGGFLVILAPIPGDRVNLWALQLIVGLGLLLGILRAVTYWILRRLRKHRFAQNRFLLVGEGAVADLIAEESSQPSKFSLSLAGQVVDLAHSDLVLSAKSVRAEIVVIAFSRTAEVDEVRQIRRGLAEGLVVLAVPRYFDLINANDADDTIFGVPVLRLGGRRRPVGRVIKRGLDIVGAAICLILLSPVLLVCGLLVKRETGAEMLFRQVRVGYNGHRFELLKFQTMKPATQEEGDTKWNISQDDRLGPVGRALRKTSLDELPQLWNILVGDMSFVGPRPERPHFVEQFSDEYRFYEERHRMPAGLTGLAQVNDLRGDTSIGDRARFDNRYADHWSLWSDFKIIIKTIPKVFKGAGG